MERWRSFFRKPGEDLWTIIEQAILLAATDYPREFKEKRCDIAEMLFARGPHHQGDPDVTRLSASVVTNCTNRMDVDETRDDEHVSAHTNEQARRDAEEHHTEFCPVEAHNDGADDHESIPTVVCSIKGTLNDPMQSDAAVLHGLQTLESLHIGVDVLKATEIGKQVNNLRKHPCKEIRLLVKLLVRQWKELVDDWVNRAVTSNDPSREGLATSDKGTYFSTQKPSGIPQHCYYDMKARDCYLEAPEGPEERGSSSRAEPSGLGRIERLEKGQINCRYAAGKEVLEDKSNGVTDRLVGMEGSVDGSLGPGRPSMDFAAGKATGTFSGSYGLGRPSIDVSTVRKQPNNEGFRTEEKWEAAKRKSQGGFSQVENAKKQQTAYPTSVKDLRQGGLARGKTTVVVPGVTPQNDHLNQART